MGGMEAQSSVVIPKQGGTSALAFSHQRASAFMPQGDNSAPRAEDGVASTSLKSVTWCGAGALRRGQAMS